MSENPDYQEPTLKVHSKTIDLAWAVTG